MDNKLTAEIKKRGIPALYSQEETADPTIYLKLYLFAHDWQWFVSECEIQGEDILFFGFVCGLENEWGYFRLSDLIETRKPVILDYNFKPLPFSEIKRLYDL